MLIGFNLTFGPMHVLGLQGMSRRINTYSSGFGFEFWNLVATIGSYILGASVLYFLWNVYKSKKEAPNLPPPVPIRGMPAASSGRSRRRRRNTTSTRSRSSSRRTTGGSASTTSKTTVRSFVSPLQGRGAEGRRRRCAPPVAVVLATRAGHRPAAHRLRRHLQPVALCGGRPAHRRCHLRLGVGAGR